MLKGLGFGSVLALLCLMLTGLWTTGHSESLPETKLRIVGGLAGVTQYTRHEEPFWKQRITEASGGKITADIAPYDRSGISPHMMLPLIRQGVVSLGSMTLALMASEEPELLGPDLAGLSPDLDTHHAIIQAYRPRLQQILAEKHGVVLLAIYHYPSQVIFCRRPFTGVSDLKGRRIRVSNVSQGDLIEDLGAIPVTMEFATIVSGIRNNSIDCVITGGISGNLIGLTDVTSHLHTLAVSWGTSAFMANKPYWEGLAPSVRSLIAQELLTLESNIWASAGVESREGAACNSGAGPCPNGRPGRMIIVNSSATDLERLREGLQRTVLPRWVRRCGEACKQAWNQMLAPITALTATD
jgi:TRAP-type C4-dicarboxylate transport system substrate-binding protein